MLIIDSINRPEALRYLACHDENISELESGIMDRCESELVGILSPRFVYRYFDIEVSADKVKLIGANLILDGADISAHLNECSGVVLIAATLGADADALIRKMQITDMARAVITDALASAAIEQVCVAAEEKIKSEHTGKYFTWRYAPGYGDFSIEIQKRFLDVLDAPRKIGLCTSESSMLTPIKSITSVMGVSETPLSHKMRGCITCDMREKCRFRKRGLHCGF
ncbi:MAG: methionine synthase [Ruminococcus sp.]|nr:methionine synthase [Ruminococcus sp.]